MEYAIIIPKGNFCIRKNIPLILEDADNGLTSLFRDLLQSKEAAGTNRQRVAWIKS